MLDNERLRLAVANVRAVFVENVPVEKVCAEHLKFAENDLESGSILIPRSSAAIVANVFGIFLEEPGLLPEFIEDLQIGPFMSVGLEHCAYFPWPKNHGSHPRLDVMIETANYLVGIEAKRYEPFDERFCRVRNAPFSTAYWRPVWGDQMRPYEHIRDRLSTGHWTPSHLGAVQLVKHAFGLRTEAARRNKHPLLIYLMAEPNAWPDGTPISEEARSNHVAEARSFAQEVDRSEVAFRSCTYREFLTEMRGSCSPKIRNHADVIIGRFDI